MMLKIMMIMMLIDGDYFDYNDCEHGKNQMLDFINIIPR